MTSAAPPVAADAVAEALTAWSRSLHWDGLPQTTRRIAKFELLDYLGALVAGRALMGMPPWLAELAQRGGRADSHIVGGHRIPAPSAALANGYFGHVLEYDDTHDEAVLHAGAATIPASLAVAEMRCLAVPRRLLEAIVLGIETTCRLGVATRLNLVEGGWIYTALLGQFGAAAAATRLLNDDSVVFRNALGIAYCLASGNHQSTREGATTKHVQPGYAAHNGVAAALMAVNGLDGVAAPFFGEDGLVRAYLHGKFDKARAVNALGKRFELDRLSFKPYPTCRLTHPAVSAALQLREKLAAGIDRLDELHLLIGPQAYDVVGRPDTSRLYPVAKVPAQFSVYWATAVALVHGEVTPAHLFSEIPVSAAVRAVIDRMRCESYLANDARDVGRCTLRATGAFGEHCVTVACAKGHPDDPFRDEEIAAKFIANARIAGWSNDEARDFASYILSLDEQGDLGLLFARLARSQGGRIEA